MKINLPEKLWRFISKKKSLCFLVIFIGFPGLNLSSAPVFTTPPAVPATATINLNESLSSKLVISLVATGTGTISYGLSSGADTSSFNVDPVTGNLSFKFFPDYERPLGRNITTTSTSAINTYKITVKATDNAGTTTKALTINVLNVDENPDPPRTLFVISQNHSNILNWTASASIGTISEYHIYRSEDSITWYYIGTVPVGTLTYTDNSLTNGKFYFYTVRSWNGVESINSNIDASTPYEPEISRYMHFDGNNNYMVVSDSSKLMGMPVFVGTTMECWVRFNTLPSGKAYILSRDYNSPNTATPPTNGSVILRWYSIYYDPNAAGAGMGRIVFEYNSEGTLGHQKKAISLTAPEVNKWYHIAGTYHYNAVASLALLKLYINGHLNSSGMATNGNVLENYSGPDESRLVIGATTTGLSPFIYGNFLDGDIAEVRYWTTDLDSAAINSNMYTRRIGDEANLIGLWHLDAKFNNQVYDYDNLNFNALTHGNVSCATPKVIAVNDIVSALASSVKYINVRKNDTIHLAGGTPTSNVLTKIVKYPSHGSTAIVVHGDSIMYTPNCFVGIDTIKYLICDTSFFHNPYNYSDTADLVITAYDNVKPLYTAAPSSHNEYVNSGCQFTIPDYRGSITATDNCTASGSITKTQTPGSGTISGHNTTQVISIRITDAAGNFRDTSFIITLIDTIRPRFTASPADHDEYVSSSCKFTIPDYRSSVTATDNCTASGSIFKIQSPPAGSVASGHNTTRVIFIRIQDDAGNYRDTSFIITLKDTIRPRFTASPSNHNDYVSSSCQFAIPDYTGAVTATDNCTAPGSITKTQTPGSGTISGHNTTQVISIRITDAAGNFRDTSFTITLKDTIKPRFTASPSNHNEYVNSSCNFTIPDYRGSVTVTDNCTASGSIVKTQNPVGTTISGHNTTQVISMRIADAAGNFRDTSFTITLKDTIRPRFAASPSSHNEYVNSACQFTIPDYRGSITATDNCTASGSIVKTQSPIGTTISSHNTTQVISLRITDAAGNFHDTSFTITLKDTIRPVYTASPSNHNEYVNSTCQFTIPDYRGSVTATDNCTASGSIIKTQNPIGTTISGHNTTQVISMRIADVAGNFRDTSFTITLKDTIRPVYTASPSSHNEYVNSSCQFTIPDYRSGTFATDNCSAVTYSQNPIGTTISGNNTTQVITIHANDANGNHRDTTFTITLKDTIRPIINGCPGNIIKSNDPGACGALVSWIEPTATDNCTATSSLVWTKSHTPGSTLPVGTTTVIYIVTDAAGNPDSCAFTVTVNDTTKPAITAPADTTINADPGLHTASGVVLTMPITSDNCGIATVTNNAPSPFPAGVTVVTWTVTDIHGNTNTASQKVTVIDNLPPSITSPNMVNVPENTRPVMIVTATDPNAGDVLTFSISGGIDSGKFIINPATGALRFVSAPNYESPSDANLDNIYIVKIQVTDGGGLFDTATISVNVTDVNEPPYFIDNLSNHITTLLITDKEDSSMLVKLRMLDEDPDGIVISSVVSLTGKSIFLGIPSTDTSFMYIPNTNINGFDTLIVIAHDNGIPQLYDTLMVIVNIQPVNDAPIIVDNNNRHITSMIDSVPKNNSKQICLRAFDVDGDSVKIINAISFSGLGSITGINNLCFTYAAKTNSIKTDSLLIVVADNGIPVMYDSLLIIMKIINTPPKILNEQGQHTNYLSDTTLENVPVEICLLTFDNENDSVVLLSAESLAGHTVIDIAANRNRCFQVTPDTDFYGKDSIKVIVADNGSPAMFDTAVIYLYVMHVNHPPVIHNNQNNPVDTLYYITFKNEALGICLQVYDPDTDRTVVSHAHSINGRSNIQFPYGGDDCLRYTPENRFIGQELLFIEVCDNGIPSLCDSVIAVITVKQKFIITQAISPNNDGINDVMIIGDIEGYPNNSVIVFNRWGDIVFKAKGYDNVNILWKGQYQKGSSASTAIVPDGTYFYLIDLADGSKPLSGFIVVKR